MLGRPLKQFRGIFISGFDHKTNNDEGRRRIKGPSWKKAFFHISEILLKFRQIQERKALTRALENGKNSTRYNEFAIR